MPDMNENFEAETRSSLGVDAGGYTPEEAIAIILVCATIAIFLSLATTVINILILWKLSGGKTF